METSLKRERSDSESNSCPTPKKKTSHESGVEKSGIVLQNCDGIPDGSDKCHVLNINDSENISLFLESSTDESQSSCQNHQICEGTSQMATSVTKVLASPCKWKKKNHDINVDLVPSKEEKLNSHKNEKLFKCPLSEVHGDFVRDMVPSHNDGEENVTHDTNIVEVECRDGKTSGDENVSDGTRIVRIESREVETFGDNQDLTSKHCSDGIIPLKEDPQESDLSLQCAVALCNLKNSGQELVKESSCEEESSSKCSPAVNNDQLVEKLESTSSKQNQSPIETRKESFQNIETATDSSSDDEPLCKLASKNTSNQKKRLIYSDSEFEDDEPHKNYVPSKITKNKIKVSNLNGGGVKDMPLSPKTTNYSSSDDEPLSNTSYKKTGRQKQLMTRGSNSQDYQLDKKHVSPQLTKSNSQVLNPEKKVSVKASSPIETSTDDTSSDDDEPLLKPFKKTTGGKQLMSSDTESDENQSHTKRHHSKRDNQIPSRKRKVSSSKKSIIEKKENSLKQKPLDNTSKGMKTLKKVSKGRLVKKSSLHDVPLKKTQSVISDQASNNDSSSDDDKPLRKPGSANNTLNRVQSSPKQESFSHRTLTVKKQSNEDLKSNDKMKNAHQKKNSLVSSASESESEQDFMDHEQKKPAVLKEKEKISKNSVEEENSHAMSSKTSEQDSDDVDSEPDISLPKVKTVVKKSTSKTNVTEDPHHHPSILRLKKYLSAAGVRVARYEVLWKDCNTIKDRASKMLLLLEQAGMKGTPTIKKCHKLKKKRERDQEMSELSKNIILTEGRRSGRAIPARSPEVCVAPEVPQKSKHAFSRIKAMFNSDSDSE